MTLVELHMINCCLIGRWFGQSVNIEPKDFRNMIKIITGQAACFSLTACHVLILTSLNLKVRRVTLELGVQC